MSWALSRLTFTLESFDRFRIPRKLICCDRGRRPISHSDCCFAQETARSTNIAALQQQEVDRTAMFVDCSEQVLSPSTNLDIGLIDSPKCGTVALVGPYSCLKLRCVAVNPAHDRGRVHFIPELLHHLRQVPVANPILAVPTNAYQDDFDREMTMLEHEVIVPAKSPTGRLMQQNLSALVMVTSLAP